MAYPRRLSDPLLIAARWEYEATPISERGLAAKYGLSRSAIHAWIIKQSWTKAEALRSYAGEEGEQQLQRDIRAAIRAARDRKITQTLERAAVLPPIGNMTKVTKAATPGPPGATAVDGPWESSPDQPRSSQNASFAEPSGNLRVGHAGGQAAFFPGADLPPQSAKTNPAAVFPPRSRTEQAAMRVRLSSLRGELALQQIQQLEWHEALLWDYQRWLEAYLNPSKFVDVAGLDPDQAAAKLEQISRHARRLVLPTERDTLAGAIQTLSKTLLASLAAKRHAAGITPRQLHGRRPQCEADEPDALPDLSTLDVESLRSVRAAMALLRDAHQRHNEPPMPPPPDRLDDLMTKHNPAPGNA